MEAGLDSLAMVEVANELQELSGHTSLPSTLVFDHPTARALAEYFSPAPAETPAAVVATAPAGSSRSANESSPAAVRGVSALLPGSVDGEGSAWRMAAVGADVISEVPAARWELGPPPPESDAVGRRSRHGGFVVGAECFDNRCFGVSAAEAAAMDPQQRLLLERGYEALHAAGLQRAALEGSATGVFCAIASFDFPTVLKASPAWGSVYAATGSSHSIASGRLSFVLGLQGPCCAYDTACSSAVAAGHAALRSVQRGECSLGLLEAVNLMLLPEAGQTFAVAGMTSARGRCHTFDARADGYARCEGCGGVVLELGGDGDASLLMAGASVRCDGRSASLTAPNVQAPRAVLRTALADSGLSASVIARVEAHGALRRSVTRSRLAHWQRRICLRTSGVPPLSERQGGVGVRRLPG